MKSTEVTATFTEVVCHYDKGASGPLPDPPIEDSRKSDQKRGLGIGIDLREPILMRY